MRLSQLLSDYVRVQHQILHDEEYLMDEMISPSNLGPVLRKRMEENKVKLAAIGKVIDDTVAGRTSDPIKLLTFARR
jgi:hypothetical protein